MKFLDLVTFVLVIIGALNWGLIWIFDFNLVTYIFGEMLTLINLIYTLVGVSALIQIILYAQVRTHITQ